MSHKHASTTTLAVIAAILGATAEALYAPLSKVVIVDTGVLMSLAFTFFGAGAGMMLVLLFGRKSKAVCDPARHLRKKDAGKLAGIILLTALANLLFFLGLALESAGTVSLLRNIGTVATVIFAAILLHEKISRPIGIGVTLIVLGSALLSFTNFSTFSYSPGSLFIIGSGIAFGALYTVMKLLADRNMVECAAIRGFGVGILALIAAFCFGEQLPSLPSMFGLMAVGFISCGLSAMFLMYGQRHLGSAKAGAIYGLYPLFGVILAFLLLGEMPSGASAVALLFFLPGMFLILRENLRTPPEKSDPDKK